MKYINVITIIKGAVAMQDYRYLDFDNFIMADFRSGWRRSISFFKSRG